MLFGVDAGTPSRNPEALSALGYNFACGYLPGGNNDHPWTKDDWNRHADTGLYLMPIFVAPYGVPTYQQGVDAGNRALEAMQQLGFSGIFTLDIENGATPTEYATGVVNAAHAGSCSVGVYGSVLTIQGMVSQSGWFWDKTWLANWVQSGLRLKPAMPDWDMWQFAEGPDFDYNVAVNDMVWAGFNG